MSSLAACQTTVSELWLLPVKAALLGALGALVSTTPAGSLPPCKLPAKRSRYAVKAGLGICSGAAAKVAFAPAGAASAAAQVAPGRPESGTTASSRLRFDAGHFRGEKPAADATRTTT